MTSNIQKAIDNLVETIRKESPETAVSFNLFINCQEHVIEFSERTPKVLEQNGITMRNLRGDFI